MTPDEVLAEFAKLPLTTRMRAAAPVLTEATAQSDTRSVAGYGIDFWCEQDLLQFSDEWDAEDAKAADHKRIRSEFAHALIASFEGVQHMGIMAPWLKVADALFDCYPHIAEGWPK